MSPGDAAASPLVTVNTATAAIAVVAPIAMPCPSSPPEAGNSACNWHVENQRRIPGIPTDTRQITGLLLAWGQGDQAAFNELVPLVHGELRRIARRCMAGERAGHSLQPTALVNEAYLRLVDVQRIR